MAEKRSSAQLLAIVHDLQAFVDLWNRLQGIAEITERALKAEYGVVSLVADEESEYWFTMGGKHYKFGGDDDELEEEGETLTDRNSRPWQFMKKELAIWQTLWREVEAEFVRRGWEFSREEYCHILLKDGWSVEMEYYPCDFEEGVHDFVYEPDEPGYYFPILLPDAIRIACNQMKIANMRLSDYEGIP